VSEADRARLIRTYRKRAGHYDVTSRLSPVPGYPQTAQRLRAVRELRLHAGDSVVEVACGTGLNFALIEEAIGPTGRIIGVDLTDAMLARAQMRVMSRGWSNVGLVQSDAAEFAFPEGIDAILSTYALTQVPECDRVIGHGAASLVPGGRWVVLDLKLPDRTPEWMRRLGVALVPTAGALDEWSRSRPWERIRAAMQDALDDPSWDELSLGTAFLAAGSGRRRDG
jgi:demethylmenaquinone methyltransferase/2-methoxy-6-polyprenyl-1,4-benzoquinol methylase